MKRTLTNIVDSVKETSAKVVNHIKENARAYTLAGAMTVTGFLADNAKAGNLSIGVNYPDTEIAIKHEVGATEGYDSSKDLTSISTPTGEIDFSSKVDFDPYRLKWDARPEASLSTVTTPITGNQLVGGSKPADISFYIVDDTNFENKFIGATVTQRADDGQGGFEYNVTGKYNVKAIDQSTGGTDVVPITVLDTITDGNGDHPSHTMNIDFYDERPDLSGDKKVNFVDYSMFVAEHGMTTTGTNYLPSDFNKDNVTDGGDLGIFVNSWLDNWSDYSDTVSE